MVSRHVGPSAAPVPRGAWREVGDDYAMRKVPAHFKRTPMVFAMPLTGVSWSMFFFGVGRTLAPVRLRVDSSRSPVTTLIGLGGLMTLPRMATKYSLKLDLLTPGAAATVADQLDAVCVVRPVLNLGNIRPRPWDRRSPTPLRQRSGS